MSPGAVLGHERLPRMGLSCLRPREIPFGLGIYIQHTHSTLSPIASIFEDCLTRLVQPHLGNVNEPFHALGQLTNAPYSAMETILPVTLARRDNVVSALAHGSTWVCLESRERPARFRDCT